MPSATSYTEGFEFNWDGLAPAPSTTAPESKGGLLKDLGASFASGAVDIASMAQNLTPGKKVIGAASKYLTGYDPYAAAEEATKAYADSLKSDTLRGKQQELGADITAGDWRGAGKRVLTDPYLLSNIVAEALPGTIGGGVIGGVVGAGLKSAGILTKAGNLTRIGQGVAAGVGESSISIAQTPFEDVMADPSRGIAASLLNLGLGIATNVVTPGNVGSNIVGKMTGAADDAIILGGRGAAQAVGRAGMSTAAEGGQEFVQSGGEALIEQYRNREDLNFDQALAQGVVGAAAGAAMGGGMHPLIGQGSKFAAKSDELLDAELALVKVEKAGGDTSVLQATVNKLRLERTILEGNAPATPEQEQALQLAELKLYAARNPTSREADDAADTMQAAVIANAPEDVRVQGVDTAVTAAVDAIHSAETLDDALANFGAHEQASSVGRVGVAAVQNTTAGVTQAIREAADDLYTEKGLAAAEADVAADPGTPADPVLAVRNNYNAIVDQQFAIASDETLSAEVRSDANARIRIIEAERDRIAPLPNIEQLPYVDESAPTATTAQAQTQQAAATPAPETYSVVRSPNGWDVVASDDSVYDTYPLSQPEDAARAATYLTEQGNPALRAEREARDAIAIRAERVATYSTLQGEDRLNAFTPLIRTQRLIAEDRSRPIEERDAATAEARRLSTLRDMPPTPTVDMPTLRPNLRYVQDDRNEWNILDENSTDYVFINGYATRAELADVIRNDTMLVRRDAEVRQPAPAAPRRGERPAIIETRNVERNFPERGMSALNDKVLEKLGTFWKTVMAGRGQRVLTVNTSNLTGRGLSQAQLTKLKDKYNAELRKQAAIWAEQNNETLPATLFDPVVSITTTGHAISVKVRGLGRNGKNPYVAINPDKIASASMYDNHINSTGLENAAGSADIGYRLFAEMAKMKGSGIDASSVLLTNNNIRRHVQSVYADTLFGPGSISPMEAGGRQSPQGVPQALWEASTPDERIGLNMLRLAHSVSENRYRTETLAAFVENLQYQRDGTIIAATEPKHANGFERGTVVTDEMLLAKLLERSRTNDSDERFVDARGVRMTNAMGRTGQGGVGVDTAKLAIMTNTVLGLIENNPDKAVPGWMTVLAKRTGREMGGWMFSRGERTAGQDATTMRDRLRKLMVNPAKFDERVTVVQSESDVPGDFARVAESEAASTRMAFYDPKTDHIWMVADNVPKGREFAVFLHEAGVHMGMRKLLGGTYGSLVMQIREWQLGSGKLENQIAQLAMQRVQDAGGETMSKRVADEELVAYFVEEAVALGVNPTALASQPKTMQAWFSKLWVAVKAAMLKFGIDPSTLTAEDVVNLAYGAARLQLNDSITDQDAAAEATTQAFDAPTTEGVTVGEPASIDDFKLGSVGGLLDKTDWAILTAENADAKQMSADENATRMQDLRDDLTAQGFMFEEADGKYGNEEHSLVVFGITEDRAQALGKKYGQEAVVVPKGLLYQDGTFVEATGVTEHTEAPADFYTKIPATGAFFTIDLNFPQDEAAPVKGETVQGVHYSNKQRTELDTSKYGTGMPGAEARRIDNGGIKERAMFYVDEGTGIKPESGVGGVPHNVTLENMYNTKTDAEGFVAAHRGDANAWEQAILDAGYNGYYAPGRDGKQGNAVVLGKKIIPIQQEGAGDNILNSIAPVQRSHPQELNIVKPRGRGLLAQIGEPIRKAFQDSHITLRRIQQLAGIDAENIKLDTMGALDRLGSKMMAKHRELVKVPLERMSMIMTEGGFTVEEAADVLGNYLKMKHVFEYNAHIATLNPAVYDAQGQHVRGFDTTHPGSGIADLDAAAELARLNALPTKKVTALRKAEVEYRKMIEVLQDFAVDRGIEKAETIATWRMQFPNYVPFNRDLDLDQNTSIGSVAGTKEFSMRAGISRSAMGSGADIINPLISTLLLGGKIVRRGEHAVVSRTLYEFAKQFTPKYVHTSGELRPMWTVNRMPPSRIVKNVNVYQVKQADGTYSGEFYSRESANAHADMLQAAWVANNPNAPVNSSGIMAEKMFQHPQRRVIMQEMPNVLNDPNVIVFPIDGENHIMVFDKESDDAVAIKKALKGEDKLNPSSPVLVPFRMMSNWVASTSTQFNPVFSFFNFARDVPAAAVNMNAHNIPGWEKSDSLKMMNEARANLMPLLKRVRDVWLHEHHDGTPVAPAVRDTPAWWHEQAVKHGGVTGVRQSFADIDSAETEIRRMFGTDALNNIRIKPGEVRSTLDTAAGVVTKIGDSFYRFGEGTTSNKIGAVLSRQTAARFAQMNEAAEASTRTAAFKMATEKFMLAGKSEGEAMILAANVSKNISTNFNRRGSWSAVANQLFPFFNAAVQGSARLAETLFEKKTITRDYKGHVMLDQGARMTPLGYKILGSTLALGAAEAIILSLAGFEDDEPPQEIKDRSFIIPIGDGDYVAVPMPYGLNNLVNFGREMTAGLMNPEKFVDHVGEAIWKSAGFSPLGATGNLLTTLSPSLIDPVITTVTNTDAFGRPIGKPNLNPADKTPGFTRAREGASDAGRWIAEALNTVSGGNEDQAGRISPTPDMVDNLLGVAGGGVGREVLKAGRATANMLNSEVLGNEVEPTPIHKIPLVGRIVGSVNSPVAQRSRMFTIREELNVLNNRYEGLLERDQTDEADAFYEAHPELDMHAEFERFARRNSKASKSRALARGNDAVGEVNRITTEQDADLADLLARYKELKNAE